MAYVLDYHPRFRWEGFLMFGLLPVALVWGVTWVAAGFRSESKTGRNVLALRLEAH